MGEAQEAPVLDAELIHGRALHRHVSLSTIPPHRKFILLASLIIIALPITVISACFPVLDSHYFPLVRPILVRTTSRWPSYDPLYSGILRVVAHRVVLRTCVNVKYRAQP